MPDAFSAKLEKFRLTQQRFARARSQSSFFANSTRLKTLLVALGRTNHWGQHLLNQWEPEYSCGDEARVPATIGDGPKWICGAALFRAPCTLVSLGSNFDASFEQAMHEIAGCRAYVVDPTLESSPEQLEAFRKTLPAFGATLNSSVGVGHHGSWMMMRDRKKRVLVGLRELLLDRFPGPHRHLSVLKVDVEGAEMDVLRDLYRMCAEGSLTIDALTVEMHVGPMIISGDRKRYTLRDMRDAFEGASSCDLMLHHKERNDWGCDGFRCAEFSWVSVKHARRVHAYSRRLR